MRGLTKDDFRSVAELARRDYGVFFELNTGFEMPQWQREYAGVLQANVAAPNSRTLIVAPVRHGKSEHCSVQFPKWLLGCGIAGLLPITKIAIVAATAELAESWSQAIRADFDNPTSVFRAIFPEVRYTSGTIGTWRINDTPAHQNNLVAVGVQGTIIGKGFDLTVIDDPVKNSIEGLSQTARNALWSWTNKTLFTRLEPGGRFLGTMSRWHGDDLVGRLLDPETNPVHHLWKLYRWQALNENDEPLWPERWSWDFLNSQRTMDPQNFFAQYQGQPTPDEGDVYKQQWFLDSLYSPADPPCAIRPAYVTVDPAVKTKAHHDYTAWMMWGYGADYRLYMLDLGRKRMPFDELVAWAKAYGGGSMPILIEDRSSGEQLIQMLRTSTGRAVIAAKADHDKIVRAKLAAPHVQGGRVVYPRGHQLLDTFIAEACNFPNDRHDDLVDAHSMGVNYARLGVAPISSLVGPPREEVIGASSYASIL